ncbi:MAG: hypothetical protein WCV58_03655 [Patescibacteria group bacterium]
MIDEEKLPSKPGPRRGSTGAKKISQAHSGPHAHDKAGGFASNPELAKRAGMKGGHTVKEKYGADFYREIGKRGGDTVKRERGSGFYAKIGHMGGKNRAAKAAERKTQNNES